MFKKDQEQQHC